MCAVQTCGNFTDRFSESTSATGKRDRVKNGKIDDIDVKILDFLQRDGRITNQALSEAVGLSASACLERVRALEKAKIISGYRAEIDLQKLGPQVTVIAEVTLEKQGAQQQRTFEQNLKKLSEVTECFEVSGQCDYILKVVCRDVEAYRDLTARILDDPKFGVANVKSRITLRAVRRFEGYPPKLLEHG